MSDETTKAPSYVTPSILWRRHADAYARARDREAIARSDAFYDDVLPCVADEFIRILTPSDILNLERLKNPLVTGGKLQDIKPEHIRQFLWLLSPENEPGLLSVYRLRKFMRRTSHPDHVICEDFNAALASVLDYLETVMQDSPGASGGGSSSAGEKQAEQEGARRPIGAHLLAVVLVPLSAEVGSFDPYDGRPWQFTPLPRIFQYLKVAAARSEGAKHSDDSPHRIIEAEWLREVNEARNAGTLIGEGEIPGSPGLSHLTPADAIG